MFAEHPSVRSLFQEKGLFRVPSGNTTYTDTIKTQKSLLKNFPDHPQHDLVSSMIERAAGEASLRSSTTLNQKQIEKTNDVKEFRSPSSSNQDVNLQPMKPVSFWGLVALIFFSVSGGPFGSEPSVAAGGPFWAILAFTVFPVVWCIPEAMITSELSSLFPGNSGFTSWITASFNSPFLGYVEGFCSFVSTATNSSVYPHLFHSYMKVHFPALEDHWIGTACMVTFILSMAYVNYRGLDIVSSLGLFLMFLIMTPFLLMVLLGVSSVDPSNWLLGMNSPPKVGSEELLALFNVLFWNLNNWDSVSTIAGEVSNARKVIPKAMISALFVTTFAYVLPLAIGTGVMKDTSGFAVWEPGYFQSIALNIGGPWLSLWILLAASVSVIGQFQALVSSCAYQLQGMAELGWLPRVFGVKSSHNTPTVGLGIAVVIVLLLTQLRFIDILQYLNVVYAFAEALEFVAFLNLRYRYGHITRPFQVPLGFFGCVVFMILPFCFIAVILFLPLLTGRWDIVAFCATALSLSVVSYWFIELSRSKRWFAFSRKPPQNIEEVILSHKTPAAGPLRERLLAASRVNSLDAFGI